jgi:hypothetical protein
MKTFLILICSFCLFAVKAQNNFVLVNNNTAVNVVVVSAENSPTEQAGVDYLRGIFGQSTVWKQCYYSGQKPNFPSVGTATYNIVNDCFVNPKPTPGTYTFNFNVCRWDTVGN